MPSGTIVSRTDKTAHTIRICAFFFYNFQLLLYLAASVASIYSLIRRVACRIKRK